MSIRTMLWIFAAVSIAIIFFMPLTYEKRINRGFSKMQASIDIKRDRVKLITFGLGPDPEPGISHKYGFDEINLGCEVQYSPEEKEYDSIIRLHLFKRNGENWERDYYNEVENLRASANH